MQTELPLELGVGVVVWTMPTLAYRLETLHRQYVDGIAVAQVYALVAGLPKPVLEQVGLTGRPSLDIDSAERLLERQGCTVTHIQAAGGKAWRAVAAWYTDSLPEVKESEGNEEAAPADMKD
jgi:hypothetical protein